jgi:hypothetical protein
MQRPGGSTTYHNVFYWATITDQQLLARPPETRDAATAIFDDLSSKLPCTCPNFQFFDTGPEFRETVVYTISGGVAAVNFFERDIIYVCQ